MGRKPGKTMKVLKAESEIEMIIQRYESRKNTIGEIAEEYGVSKATMQDIIKQYYSVNGRKRPVFRRRISEKQVAAVKRDIKLIVQRFENGEKPEEIANEYGVSSATIRRKVNEYYEMKEKDKTRKETTEKIEDIEPNDGRRTLQDAEIILDALKDGISIPEIFECARKCNVYIPCKVLEEAYERWKVERDMKNRSLEDGR